MPLYSILRAVFPLSAVATAAVKYAEGARSVPSEVLAWTLVSGAVAMTCAVFCRFSHHQIAVMCVRAHHSTRSVLWL
eukprot:6214371-Pleurochrysis_carterae.AAC.2